MDHDLIMMVYGAIIGIGSSFATTLFQSWLESRKYDKRKKKENYERLNEIYIPKPEETREILGSINNSHNINSKSTGSDFWLRAIYAILILLFLTVIGGLCYSAYWISHLIYKMENPTAQISIVAVITFSITAGITLLIKSDTKKQ